MASPVAPNLPGFVSNKPVARPLPQLFNNHKGVVLEKRPKDEPELDYTKAIVDRALKARAVPPAEKLALSTTKSSAITAATALPVEVECDRQVSSMQGIVLSKAESTRESDIILC